MGVTWEAVEFRKQRLDLIYKCCKVVSILLIDETGEKKGQDNRLCQRQYIRNLGLVENGIVAIYRLWVEMTFPLTFEVYKQRKTPKGR